MDYVKLKDGTEYKIDEFGTGLKRRDRSSSSGDHWFGQCAGRLKILDIQAESNTNVKCLLEDGKWYHIGSNGGLVPTLEQREKDREKERQTKEANSDNAIGAIGGLLWGSKKKKEIKGIQQEPMFTDYNYEAEDNEEDDDIDELLGEDFDEKEPSDQITLLFKLYKGGEADGEQICGYLEDILEENYTKVDAWFEQFEEKYEDCREKIRPKELAETLLKEMPLIYRYKYPELQWEADTKDIEKDDDLVESSGMFDISSKMKNKTIKKLKDNIKSSLYEMERNTRYLRDSLISDEKEIKELIEKEVELKEIENRKVSNGAGFFQSIKENKQKKSDISRLKETIDRKKDYIKSKNDEIKKYYNSIKKAEGEYKKLAKELLDITKNKKYTNKISFEGEGIRIAEKIAKNPKDVDSKSLKKIFQF